MNRNKIIAVILFSYWVFLILFAYIDSTGSFGTDIGLVNSLQTSSLARVMFVDIGGLSTFAAVWITVYTKSKLRIIFAVLTLFVGSYVALPYISYSLWHNTANKDRS